MIKRIFLIGSLAIAGGFGVANLSIAEQDIRMSLFSENAIALSSESSAPALQPCYMSVTSKPWTLFFVRKCASGTNGSTIKPCNDNLIETASGYFSDWQWCSENTN